MPSLSVRRPITVLMGTLAVVVFGFMAGRRLPLELLPDLAYPTLTIQTEYPDAAPISVEQFVTRPIEESVGVIPGIRDLRSVSRAGFSEVTLQFDWGEEMDFVALDVREKLGLVELPRETETPRVLRYDPSLDPIVRLAFTGERDLDELRQLAERWLKPRLEAVPGVAAAKVRGGLVPEIQVEADQDRLATLGLTLSDLGAALAEENVNRPGGTLKDWGSVYLVRTLHEFEDLEQLERTIVRETPQGRVRVEDVAEVTRGHRDRDEITRAFGEETIEIALHREGSANTIEVAEAIRLELDLIRGELTGDLGLVQLTDQSKYIASALDQVWSAALMGGLLAILVLYFFLRDVRATVIIALTIPVSVIATFLPMDRAGVSLNIMSLGGLALGIGMLVDNSIVVLESIDRRRREGEARRVAAAEGAGEVAGAVTAATLTTISVFLPIVFVQGIAGQLFYDLAVTVCLSLVASLVVSLTLIPSLAGLSLGELVTTLPEMLFPWDRGSSTADDPPGTLHLGPISLRPIGNGRHWFSRMLTWLLLPVRLVLVAAALLVLGVWWCVSTLFHLISLPVAKTLDGVGHVYPGALTRALRLRFLILPVTIAIFLAALWWIPKLGTSLVPDLAQGEFAFQLSLPEGTPLESTAEVVERIEALVKDDLGDARMFSVVGSLPSSASGRQTLGENLAQINVVMPDDGTREAEEAAARRFREVISLFPRVDAELVHPSVLSVRPPIEVHVFSDDLSVLDRAADQVLAVLTSDSTYTDVTTTIEPGSPEVTVVLDRERASRLGVTAELLGQSLRHQIRGELVGEFREAEERIDIRLRASAGSRDRAEDVSRLPIRLSNGTVVPVHAVADVQIDRGPAAIHRVGGARVAQLTASIESGQLGQRLAELGDALRANPLPGDAVAELAGQNEELEVSVASLKLALALAIFLVFVVMAMQFESIIHPFVILLSVPLGLIGVVLALAITSSPISVLALIGTVMLAGIVVNNAIVLVDAINRRRRSGEALEPAIIAAGRERLRPILMTTATTVLGLLPMALGLGAGDELRRPMAITVIGGLSVATLLTLIVIPCLYRLFSRRDQMLRPTTSLEEALAHEPQPNGSPSLEPAAGASR
ncbi:MAG: efflux RND transporter permease subunit [Planctomycetota bacterium]